MQENDDHRENPNYLHFRIAALEQMLSLTIATMPPTQRSFLSSQAREYAKNAAEEAKRRNTDPCRDEASAAYEMEELVQRAIDDAGAYWDELQAEF